MTDTTTRKRGRPRVAALPNRTSVYLPDGPLEIANRLLPAFNGNASDMLTAALNALDDKIGVRRDLITAAVVAYWQAVQPDGSADPADNDRAESPHMLLSALLGEVEAQAIGLALRSIV